MMSRFEFLDVRINKQVATVRINNPKSANALHQQLWLELQNCAAFLHEHQDVKVVILGGHGKHFCAGVHLDFLKSMMTEAESAEHPSEFLYQQIKNLQQVFSAINGLKQPVIACIHGACLGAGLDLISACDIKFATLSATFSIMETKLGVIADIGVLQRLPQSMADGHLRELAYTSKPFRGLYAKNLGLVNDVFVSSSRMYKKAERLAFEVAKMPAHAVQGSKKTINFNHLHRIEEELDRVARLNAEVLMSKEAKAYFKKVTSSS